MMRKISAVIILAIALWQWATNANSPSDQNKVAQSTTSTNKATSSSQKALENAFKNHLSDVQVQAQGTVVHLLPDDTKGSQHQKFLVKMPSGQTILIAHNIDLAPRINAIAKGDTIEFYGEYEWSDKGGVVHWTHHDPGGRHIDGWLKHQGRTYQ